MDIHCLVFGCYWKCLSANFSATINIRHNYLVIYSPGVSVLSNGFFFFFFLCIDAHSFIQLSWSTIKIMIMFLFNYYVFRLVFEINCVWNVFLKRDWIKFLFRCIVPVRSFFINWIILCKSVINHKELTMSPENMYVNWCLQEQLYHCFFVLLKLSSSWLLLCVYLIKKTEA